MPMAGLPNSARTRRPRMTSSSAKSGLKQQLARTNPSGRWEYFLTDEKRGLRWDRVIVAGSSHGSTTATRFAKHQRVDRVVMFCGPRDQYETWQALPSATPA